MKTIYFKQCQLSRKIETGIVRTTSYIAAKYAVVGMVLKMKNEDETWTNGWIVDAVHEPGVPEELLPDVHNQIKGHRKNTGDSLPKKKDE